ncbi:flagellar biosynthetic protein FliR [uncultured Rheinheimera sp.]|uniref:flagellar biosynthetic protein FliR n=1 Tax=uncultured Rheinheimera sp. TaxID=400532 RepID=UPI002593A1AE|nr:flagellar biosynthetic protein FliR [uncultured Rheinheimera sp.]
MSSLLSLTTEQLMVWFGTLWWPFVRLAAFFWALPVFDNPAVVPRARIILALFLSFLLAPSIEVKAIDPFSLEGAVVTLEQVIFAVIMAGAVRMLFEVLALVGLMISMQMGLSMAMMMDPASGDSVSVLSQLFWVMTALLFFALNGHLISLQIMVDSFNLWPVGASLYQLDLMLLINLFGWMFGAALLVALPAIIAMLLVNLTFGIASRSAPSMNLFSLGFPMTLLLGFVCVFLTLSQMGNHFTVLAEHVLGVMQLVMS